MTTCSDEIMVDHNGDAVEDVTFQFRFTTQVRNPNTFLAKHRPDRQHRRPELQRASCSVTRVAASADRCGHRSRGEHADAAGQHRQEVDP
jgi:hypothetical protein